MKKIRILFTAMAVAMSTLNASAQLSLDECQRLAAEHYPLLQRYQLIKQTTDYTLDNLKKGYLPQLSLEAQASLQSDVMTLPSALENMLTSNGYDVKGIKKDQYRVGVNANQLIYDGGAIKASKGTAAAQGEVDEKKTDVDMYQLKERVNNLFFGVLLAEEKIQLNEDLQTLLLDNCRKVEAMVKNGVAMRSDKDAIRAEYLNVRQQNTELKSAKDSYLQMLEIFIGKKIDSKLAKPAVSSAYDGVSERPELQYFNAQANLLKAKEKELDASIRPRLSAFAQGYYGYPGYDMFGNMFSHDWSLNGMIGLKLSWNISNFYTHKNSKRKLEVARAEVENAKDVFLFNNNLQSTQNRSNIDRYDKVMKEDEEIISLRTSVRKSAEEKLFHGVIDVNNLLQEINRENSAKIAFSTHEIEKLKSIYELKYTLNK